MKYRGLVRRGLLFTDDPLLFTDSHIRGHVAQVHRSTHRQMAALILLSGGAAFGVNKGHGTVLNDPASGSRRVRVIHAQRTGCFC